MNIVDINAHFIREEVNWPETHIFNMKLHFWHSVNFHAAQSKTTADGMK